MWLYLLRKRYSDIPQLHCQSYDSPFLCAIVVVVDLTGQHDLTLRGYNATSWFGVCLTVRICSWQDYLKFKDRLYMSVKRKMHKHGVVSPYLQLVTLYFSVSLDLEPRLRWPRWCHCCCICIYISFWDLLKASKLPEVFGKLLKTRKQHLQLINLLSYEHLKFCL